MKRLCLTDAYPVAKLRPHPDNYRDHDLDGIERILRARGQHRTIVVRADDPADPLAGGTVLAGHGVFHAARDRLGWELLAASVMECDDAEAEEEVVADNRWGRLGGSDPKRLHPLLADIHARGGLERVGYTVDDYEDLLARAGAVAVTPTEPFAGGYAESDEETAQRAAQGAATPVDPIRQVVLVFSDPDAQDAFLGVVEGLRRAWHVEEGGITAVVVEAVHREVEAIR